jgi:hypothetical protein
MRCRSCAGNRPAAMTQRLLLARTRKHFVQARFASLRGVPMDNAAFGRLIDRGNKSTHVVRIGLDRTTRALLHAAQTRDRAAIAKCSAHILAGAFGSGFGVGHDLEKLWARRLVEPRWIVKMPNGHDSSPRSTASAEASASAALQRDEPARQSNYARGMFCARTALLCGGFDPVLRGRAELVQVSDSTCCA